MDWSIYLFNRPIALLIVTVASVSGATKGGANSESAKEKGFVGEVHSWIFLCRICNVYYIQTQRVVYIYIQYTNK